MGKVWRRSNAPSAMHPHGDDTVARVRCHDAQTKVSVLINL
eukprot:SAG31_NODE_31103_length_372_cov_0.750916_1_plen_40_part_10